MFSSRPFFRRPLSVSVSAVFLAAVWIVPPACAETWNSGTGATWNSTANWTPASIPNSVGASAIFNNAASANNAAQTANRTITLDGPQTVGSIIFNDDAVNTFTNSLTTGTGGSLIFDQTGTGSATINVPVAAGTGNNTISAAITLNDTLLATVDDITASSAAGALNLTATISGAGGFIKAGDGLATFGTGAKTYTGLTALNGGRMRISLIASPTATSSFTINSGGQLDLIAAGTYTFGSGPLNLNGAGPTSGPFAVFPGAIRADTGLAITITNNVTLQSNTLVHVQGSAAGSLTFTSPVSGPGGLTLTAPGSDANQGILNLNGINTYAGGTTINGGTLVLSAATATLGTGSVSVMSGSAIFGGLVAKLSIQSGVLNAIANNATLSLAGGATAGVADDGFVELQSGINEIVSGLNLGGAIQIPGTYGSSVSTALFKNDEYFSGPGVVTVIPEPSTSLLVLASGAPLLFARRRSARPL